MHFPKLVARFWRMSAASVRLIDAFESLPTEEKQIVLKEILLRLPPLDSGPFEDEQLARAGDDLATMLEKEEHESETR
jgi:hypothetical protein